MLTALLFATNAAQTSMDYLGVTTATGASFDVDKKAKKSSRRNLKPQLDAALEKLAGAFGKMSFPEWKEENKSLLKKHMTKEVFEQLKDKKTARGVTLKDVINSGIANQDSGVGVYMGDEESYTLFGPLVNPIIEDYHKPYKATDTHPADFDPSHLKVTNPDPDNKYIVSTRIRVARNLKGYGLTPTLTKKERVEVEQKVVSILKTLDGDLKGTYYPLSGMDEKTRQQLVDDHFLFKKGDRFLEAAGINREWPEGRGIYHNNDKTFLVWVNEEDQLRIISMQKGGDILAVFTRLAKAVNELSTKLGFQFNPNFGYLSSCPTNLGTGMRASVHIAIPNAVKHPDYKKVLEQYHIDSRGIHGEHSESVGGVYDISNKRRLGLSEVQCVQDMYEGVKRLIEMDQEMANKCFEFPQWTDKAKSLLRKHMNQDVFNQLKDKKTARGVTFKDVINSGVVNQDSGVGVYMGDEESYTLFAPLINAIIEDYHKPYKATDTHPADFDPSHLKVTNPDPENKYIKSTRIRVARNLKGHGLTPTLGKQERVDIEKKVVGVLTTLEGDLKGKYFPLSGMDEATRQKLVEDHFLFKRGDRFLEAAGINQEWPEGRGIYHNDDKTFLVWVNEEDELRIISMQPGGDILAVFSRLAKAVNELSSKLGFQFSPNFGYLSACPTNLGTGMRASVHIAIPNAIRHPDYKKVLEQYHIDSRGIHGEHSESVGGVYDISNKRRLGLSEVQCVQDMYEGVKRLIEMDQEMAKVPIPFEFPQWTDKAKSLLRKHMSQEVFNQLKDKKTARGVTFKDVINSGVVNQDSGVGVYMGDEESYTLFAPLINAIIEDYHKPYKATDTHPADFDPSHLKVTNPDPENKYIKSTRIRVARNLKGHGLTPTLGKQERVDIEKKVVGVLTTLEGDLKGKYFPLSGMDEATRQKLVEDHFLFKRGDRFLEAAGINQEWPEGRGIYHNDDKTFLVWVNEEDELRIISMQPGGDILAVFSRLAKAVNELSSKLGFQFSPNFGYLSACPTNLGTGMRASVHIAIPNAIRHPDYKKVLEQYHIDSRGIHGEHSESVGGVYDISNKRRLGLSEVQCVQDMYEGVKRLIEMDQEMAKCPPCLEFPQWTEKAKSLLRKHMSKEVFDQLKDKKTARGVTLKDVINSGIVNEDSGVGVYMGDEESYTLFAPLINAIIEDYHKPYKATDTHPADFDPSHLKVTNPDPENKYIKSTRIRVARNLKGHGLTPTLGKQERVDIEKKVVGVLSTLGGELKGKYFPLTGMDEATRQKLVDDHFLFKRGDRFLEAAGINQEWPEGRGIYHNDDKTFLVWVNEEDELRIISMQPGGDILAVFSRLACAVNELSSKLGFQFSPNFGYLSACPTNLGTGMRASVHIAIPNAVKHPDYKKVLEQFHIDSRGIHGEHSESVGGVYDISNKRRLGLSEVQCVQDMYEGVKRLIEMDQEIAAKGAGLEFPQWTDKAKSLLRKHMSQEVFNQLKDKKTARGVTFKDVINSGVVNQDSGVGVYMGDEESYTLFAPLINAIIEDYHKPYKATDTHPADFDPSHLKVTNPDPENKYIKSTRIRVARNLKGHGLTPTLGKQERVDIEKKVVGVLTTLEGDLKGKYFPLSGMDEATRQKLVDDHFLFKRGDRFLEAAGINQEWPEGRGIYHNDDKTFLVWVNEEDELRIISMQPGGDILAVFSRLAKAVNELSSKLGFQFSPNFGYLSACPTNLGTGMRASVHIAIPNAIRHPDYKKVLEQYHIDSRGIHGEHSESVGGVYDISNKRRLGLSEVQCVQDMYEGVKRLIEMDQEMAKVPTALEFPTWTDKAKSLLRKHMSHDVFNQLKDKKTARGVTFKDVINSGIVNQDSGVGVYMGDEESYTLFAPLINAIIEDYHNPYKVTDSHPADFDPSHLKVTNPDPENKYIKSTRIRVARNLKGHGLTPTLGKEERVELEKKVVGVLTTLEGDLKGKYFPLSGMDEATRQKLVDDHFLFKRGDRFLEAAGINNEWPEGRGIYHNDNKTFLVWVNEEDELRIISMQPGGDIMAVFSRLACAVNELSSKLGFQFSPNLGYLSACPTNLGTGMRASVHIAIPNAIHHPDYKKVLEQYHIDSRGIHGEHSESVGGVYDISNKRRLGLSEVQCVQDMYEGVKRLIEMDQEMANCPEFPRFTDKAKSLLRKHMSLDVFKQLQDKKTARGVTLKNVINSGVVNEDSGVGVYMGDEESYTLFGPLINPIIEDYHKPYKATDTHPADFDPSHLKATNPDPDNKYIKSTRIRVARNMKGYGLTPTLGKEERVELEKKVVEVLTTLGDDLKGKYYPLSGMDEATRQKLVDDHFLFKRGDRFLEAAGINNEWPEGRGIYHNDDKTFLVWVNEEDELRIISMQPGGDIMAVFSRLAKAVNELSSKLGFQFSPNFGYLSACPTNLGTGMRASVHIAIPNAVKHPDYKKVLEQYHIDSRGIHGEHSESVGGVYDISNKRRLGLSEVQCVQDMYEGVKRLIEMDQEMAAKCSFEFPQWTDKAKSLLRKHLSQQVFDQLKDKKTARGVTFKDVINSGVVNQDSGVGVYMGDEESYTLFAPLINAIIEDYHNPYKATDTHPADFDPSHLKVTNPDPENKYIKSTRIRVARNLKGHGLTPTLGKQERVDIEKKVVGVLTTLEGDLKGKYFPLSGMDEATRQKLVDDHFLFKRGDRFLEAAGINNEWPEGRGIYHNDDKTFLVWVNEEDELRIISMQPGGDILAVFTRLAKAVNELSSKLGFQFSPNFGYLSACPTNLGTGMRASVHIAIPNAVKHADYKKVLEQYHIDSRGIHGEHSESVGGVYDISNKRRLGLSEVQCVQDMYEGVKRLIEMDKEMASK